MAAVLASLVDSKLSLLLQAFHPACHSMSSAILELLCVCRGSTDWFNSKSDPDPLSAAIISVITADGRNIVVSPCTLLDFGGLAVYLF